MKVEPADHFINWQQDPFSNYLGRLVFTEKTALFEVDVDIVADMIIINPFDYFLEPDAETFPFSYEKSLKEDLAPYLARSAVGEKLREYVLEIDRSPRRTIDFLVDLNMKLSRDISYLIRLEPNVQSCEQTLSLGSGSCRDSAWLLVNILRLFGLAARFVSGYLIQLKQDVKSLDGPSGAEEDFTDLHAWTEVYIPGAGWIGMDPTSGLFAGEGHIPLACSPEPQSAAPITGALDECEVDFHHTMSVKRIFEAPRSTRPYSEETWQSIVELGERVDQELVRQDVRLSMGGEPTFVSIDDMEGAQWNTEALGREKQELAESLLKSLKQEWAPGGLLHYGQGKWYPGESLPRWALGCYWRKDGKPLWKNSRLLADVSRDYGSGIAEAKQFIETLADILEVSRSYIREGFEDTVHYLHKEQLLPVNVDPLDPRINDPEERARMVQAFRRGLGAVVSYVLPLQHGSWKSGPWPFRGDRMFLLPGDSPAGLRLPLDSLPWVAPEDIPEQFSLDPMADAGPLPDLHENQTACTGIAAEVTSDGIRSQPGPVCRSASRLPASRQPGLCGRRSAFSRVMVACMCSCRPSPLSRATWSSLAAVEKTAETTGIPVVIEGYTPPSDQRLECL